MPHLRSTLSGTVRRWEAKDEPLPLPISNLIHLAKGLTLPPNVTPLAFLPRQPATPRG